MCHQMMTGTRIWGHFFRFKLSAGVFSLPVYYQPLIRLICRVCPLSFQGLSVVCIAVDDDVACDRHLVCDLASIEATEIVWAARCGCNNVLQRLELDVVAGFAAPQRLERVIWSVLEDVEPRQVSEVTETSVVRIAYDDAALTGRSLQDNSSFQTSP